MTRAYVRVVGLILIGVAGMVAFFDFLSMQPPSAIMGSKLYATWARDLPIHRAASVLTVLLLVASGAVCWWASRRVGDRLTPAVAWWLAGSAVAVFVAQRAEAALTSYGSPGIAQAVFLAACAVILRPTTFTPESARPNRSSAEPSAGPGPGS